MTLTKKVKVGDSTTQKGSALSRDQQIDAAIAELQAAVTALQVITVLTVAKAAAITVPTEQGVGYIQADVESIGDAVDAIITVLKNAGLTA